MSDPRKLLDDGAADGALRDALRTAADVPPPALDYDGGLRALRDAIARGGGGGAPGGGGSGTAIGALAVVVALGIVWVWYGSLPGSGADPDAVTGSGPGSGSGTDTAPAAGAEAEAEADPETVAEAEAGAETEAEAGAETEAEAGADEAAGAETEAGAEAEAGAEPEAGAEAGRAPHGRDRRPSDDRDDGWMRETLQLHAMAAALDTDPARTLELAEAARREFGRGRLGDDRDAIHTLALFALGREDRARAMGARVLARDPDGLYAERIRRQMEER
jgi:hypothetical protein